jgi:hypothetical protein
MPRMTESVWPGSSTEAPKFGKGDAAEELKYACETANSWTTRHPNARNGTAAPLSAGVSQVRSNPRLPNVYRPQS